MSQTTTISTENSKPMKSKKKKIKLIIVDDNAEEKATTIQSRWRGYHVRRNFRKLNDNYTFEILDKCIDKYIDDLQFNSEINARMSKKKRRNENFPSDISENIAKFAVFKKYHVMPCWDTHKGDIAIDKIGLFKQLEIKGFMSSGPASFGPKEAWDILYFVDARDIYNKNFKVYEVKMTNKNEIFRNIKISKTENYGIIADSGRRPRGSFDTVFKPQLGNDCKLIFDGHISELDNTV